MDSGGSLRAAPVEAGEPSELSGIMPIAVNDSASSLRRASAIDEQEHVADVMRLRTVLTGAIILWAVTGILDWSVVRFVQPGPLSYFLALRGVAWLIIGVALLRLFMRPPPSPRLFRALDLIVFCTASVAASLMCLKYRGIASPYAHAISCILVVRGVSLPNHYRRGLFAALLPAALFPATLLFMALFLPALRQQLGQPAELAIFLQNVTLTMTTGALTVLGGHSMWALRRQVFAARNIGRYRLQHRIGQGGMGDVWKAYHPSLRRAVAIKLLKAHESSPGALARFEREVRATSELKHPNTVRVFDFGITEDGLWYYAMELLEGETVGLLVEREGPLPPLRAVRLMRQACRALAEAHGRGIVHRDIKPDNLFVTTLGGESDFIKVLDFGIAKLLDDELLENVHVTVEGSVLGTPAFMSPEQFEAQGIDARTDVFSLGAVLYFMLTGHPPYHGNTLTAIRAAHFTPVKPPSTLSPFGLPPAIDALVLHCLEREPTRRFASAALLDEMLSEVEEELRKEDPPPAPASAQGSKGSSDELARDALSDENRQVGVVERVGEPSREGGSVSDVRLVETPADE
jgi:hypothetical protein